MSLICKVPAHIQSEESTSVAKDFLFQAANYNLTAEGMALEDFKPEVPEGFQIEKDFDQGTISLRNQEGWVIVRCTEV